jgi:predicted transcriptional regulator
MTVTELKKTRKTLGITQKQLSKLLKKDATFVCKLENGVRKFNYDLEVQLKKAFGKLKKGLR